MDFRLAQPSDRDGICTLWQEVFGDSREAVEEFFHSFPRCRSYVAAESGQVLSMVHALPQTLSPGIPAAYLYAVATAPSHRRQGLCRRLMKEVHKDLAKEGVRLAVLTPAEPALFAFYGAMGYTPAFSRSHCPFPGGREISVEEYAGLREQLLGTADHMICDLQTLQYAARLYGLTFYRTDGGCAAVSPQRTLEVLPQDLGGAPCAMALWLRDPIPLSGAFPGYALD